MRTRSCPAEQKTDCRRLLLGNVDCRVEIGVANRTKCKTLRWMSHHVASFNNTIVVATLLSTPINREQHIEVVSVQFDSVHTLYALRETLRNHERNVPAT
jgi:hypothetical protein